MTNEYIHQNVANKLNTELKKKKIRNQFNRNVFIYFTLYRSREKKKREMKHRVAIKINKYRWANKKNKKKKGEGETRYDFRGYKGTKACLAYLKSVTVELLKWWRRQW